MTRILGRRARLLVLVGAVALVAAGCVSFSGTKVVTGEGTPTGDFVVRITCEIGAQTITEDLTFHGEETVESEPFSLLLSFGEASCFITEIEQAGATTVTYQCGDIIVDAIIEPDAAPEISTDSGGPGSSAFQGGPPPPAEATCTETPDGLEVEISIEDPAQITVNFTVINDFAVTPPTTAAPTTTAPPQPAPVEAVAPTPVPTRVVTFTG